jgi:hypothetical protein
VGCEGWFYLGFNERAPELLVDLLGAVKPVHLAESYNGLACVFTALAIDLAWGGVSSIKQDLRFYEQRSGWRDLVSPISLVDAHPS